MQNGVTGKLQEQESTNHPGGTIDVNTETDRPSESTDHPAGTTDDSGTLHVRGGQVNYVDSSHWVSILHDIKEVREQLSLPNTQVQEDPSFGDVGQQPEADLVFGPPLHLTISEILQSLPPRPVCDSLLSQYFNAQYTLLRMCPRSRAKILYLLC